MTGKVLPMDDDGESLHGDLRILRGLPASSLSPGRILGEERQPPRERPLCRQASARGRDTGNASGTRGRSWCALPCHPTERSPR